MLLPLVFLWFLFVGGTVGEVDDDEDETEFALVSSQINRIATHGIFLIFFWHSLFDQSLPSHHYSNTLSSIQVARIKKKCLLRNFDLISKQILKTYLN